MTDSMNQLELWNRSRELSSELLQAYEDGTSFTNIESDMELFPFSTETEFTGVMSSVSSESRKDTIDELQKIIYERVKSLVGFNVDETVDNTTVLQSWNNAQSATKDLLDWHSTTTTDKNDDTPEVSYDTVYTNHHEVLPEDEETALALISDAEEDSYVDTHKTLTRLLYETDGEFDTDSVDSEDEENADEAFRIAESLVEVFADRKEDLSYRDVKNNHPDIDSFPSRDESMMVVMNTSAETRHDRIDKIRDWVYEWMTDEEYAEQLSHSRQPRMGMN